MIRTRRPIVLLAGIAVAMAAAAGAVRAADDRSAYRAIWKIIDTQRRNQATAVAVGPRRALTNAHVLYEFVRQKSTALLLRDARERNTVHIVGPIVISATYDLALVETAEPMPRYLRIARGLPLGRADQLQLAGYPKQRFATLRATQEITLSTKAGFRLPMEQIINAGFSGGPVLAPNDEIVGIHKTSTGNIAGNIPATTVHEFLTGAIGVRCRSRALGPCLERATGHTRALASQGNADAQYQLGRGARYIPGGRDLGLLERSARQGNPEAQYELSGIYEKGAPGIGKDLMKAAYWSEDAARQGHEDAQRNSAIYYFNGEGVARDLETSNAWLDRAVKSGLVDAEYDLGYVYRHGEGVPRDPALARYWFRRAAKRGHAEAAKALAEMGEPEYN